jgi:3D (Asp-Asp-Asp) domain-containing protein
MKSFKLILCLSLSLSPAAFGKNVVAKTTDAILARITVYWASGGEGSDSDTRNHRCATGARLRNGHCAVDPRRIPFGSRILLPTGETLAAVDTGTAVRNRKAARLSGRTVIERNALVIDRFFETKGQALAWAASHPAFMAVKVSAPLLRQQLPATETSRRNRPALSRPT